MALELDPNYVFRDFVTHGVPSSGAWDPRKQEIRRLLTEWWQTIIALVADAGGLELPNLLISMGVTGGTANNIVATPSLPVPSTPATALFAIAVEKENTGNVTLNGKPLLTNGGEQIAPGEILPGDLLLFLDAGEHYRLLTDTGSLRNKLAAEAAAGRALAIADSYESLQQAVDQAGGSASSAATDADRAEAAATVSSGLASAFVIAENTFATKATAEAWHPVVAPDYIRIAGYVAANDGGGGLYARRDTEPTHDAKFSITLADGVTVAWYELVDSSPSVLQTGANRTGTIDAFPGIVRARTRLRNFASMGSGGVLTGDQETLYLPHGIYEISDTIFSTNMYAKIVGDKAKIVPSADFDLAKWALDMTLWHGRVEGLIFDGFKKSLNIHNPNTDRGNIKVIDCEFNGEDIAAAVEAQSTKIAFRDCQWNRSVRALDQINCDFVEIAGGWLKQGTLTEDYSATIESTGVLHMHNVLGVPNPAEGSKTAWINNNRGAVKASFVRFGGESGAMTLVNNFAPADTTYPIRPEGIHLEGCDAYTAGRPGIRCFALPNYIYGYGNVGYADMAAWVTFDDRDTDIVTEVARVRSQFEIVWRDRRPITNRVLDQSTMQAASVYVTDGDKISYPLSVSRDTHLELLFRGNNTREQSPDFRRYNAFRVTLISSNVPTNDNVSEYFVQAGYNQPDAYQITAAREGAGNSAPRLFKDTGDADKLKVKLNATVATTTVWCVVEQMRINGMAYDQS